MKDKILGFILRRDSLYGAVIAGLIGYLAQVQWLDPLYEYAGRAVDVYCNQVDDERRAELRDMIAERFEPHSITITCGE